MHRPSGRNLPVRPYKIVIRRVPGLSYRTVTWRWRWSCGLCKPASNGVTSSFEKTVRNVGRHMRRRQYHHEYVKRTRAWGPML